MSERELENLDGFFYAQELREYIESWADVHSVHIYGMNKAWAMDARMDGDIQLALWYEDVCERAYAEIPEELKW